jgi:hypothetical protein
VYGKILPTPIPQGVVTRNNTLQDNGRRLRLVPLANEILARQEFTRPEAQRAQRLPIGGVEFRMLAQLLEDNVAQGHGSLAGLPFLPAARKVRDGRANSHTFKNIAIFRVLVVRIKRSVVGAGAIRPRIV